MKEKREIQHVHSILSIIGLVLLLLFSPCKVRNFIQSEVGVPLTKVLNKSQSTVSLSTSCSSFELAQNVQQQTTPPFQQSDNILNSGVFSFEFAITFPDYNNTFSIIKTHQSITDVPLYILYQSLRHYS